MEHVRTLTPSARRTDLLAVVGAGILWGTGGLTGALLIDRTGLGVLAVASYRLLIGGGLVTLWLLTTGGLGRLWLSGRGAGRLLLIGALAALYQSCYFAAVSLTSVSLATLVTLGASPVLVVAAESVLGRRWPSRPILLAVAMAIAGLVLLVGAPAAGDPAAGDPAAVLAGTACALGSASGFAAITMLGARPVDGLGPLPTAGLLLYLGLAPTALAYALYFTGLRSVATGSAALTSLLEPLTAAVLGVVVLDERLGVAGLAGGVLVGVAVLMTATGRRR